MVKVAKYECDKCGEEYETEEDARECENTKSEARNPKVKLGDLVSITRYYDGIVTDYGSHFPDR